MRRIRLIPALALALMATPSVARAQLGIDYTTGVSANYNWFTLGWSFNVVTPFTVGALGFYDADKDGLTQTHEVGLWTIGGTLLASATVANSDPLYSFWRFASIAPLNLAVGTYIIAGANHGEAYPLNDGVGTTFNSKISYGTDWYVTGDPFTLPNTTLGAPAGPAGWPAANFLEVDPGAPEEVVPEPATMTLLASGLAALAAKSRRKKVQTS